MKPFEKYLELTNGIKHPKYIPKEITEPYDNIDKAESICFRTISTKREIDKKVDLNFVRRERKNQFDPSIRLTEIIRDHKRIREWQNMDKNLRNAITCLKNNMDANNKNMPVKTL
jgi:hypothetical protein